MDQLKAETAKLGKPSWRPLLSYVAALHARSTHPPRPPFPHPWEEIGPGYCYGPAFGHWDIVHQLLDTLPVEPEHARAQILNNLAAQQDDGLVPGAIWMKNDPPTWSHTLGHPPVWPLAATEFARLHHDDALLAACYEPLARQIGWFEAHRRADDGTGFFYTDILDKRWESGVDEGIRFTDDVPTGKLACVDATSHGFALYDTAADWAAALNKTEDAARLRRAADTLRHALQTLFFDDTTGFFHDAWVASDPDLRRLAFEGIWPVVVGAATSEQATRVIDENLLGADRFFAPHPIRTVARTDPHYEKRMWRGPAWNSMTLWAARGCVRYNRPDAARLLLEGACDASAAWFDRLGTIFEFYDSDNDDPRTVARKPHTPFNAPCPDYLGHNPLLAMARLWEAC